MAKDDEESSKDVLTAGKKEDDERKERDKEDRKERELDDRDRDRGPAQSYPSQQGYYPPPPPRQPMFTPQGMPKIVAIGILIGLILLFVGSMISVGAGFMDPSEEDDAEKQDDQRDLQRNLVNTSRLVNAIGLFLAGLFVILPLMLIKDLSTNQRIMLVILLVAIIVGFTLTSLTVNVSI